MQKSDFSRRGSNDSAIRPRNIEHYFFNLIVNVVLQSIRIHYDETPMQYTVIFHGCKSGYFQMKKM